jgi:hypothetical protein
MKISIDGQHFDTAKASQHWELYYWDGSNGHSGSVYRSSRGTWYVNTPSQWSNRRAWMVMLPEHILSEFDRYLTQEDKEDIATVAGIDWE